MRIAYTQDEWHVWLPYCELALNCRTSTSTGMTPSFSTTVMTSTLSSFPNQRRLIVIARWRPEKVIARKHADAQDFAQTMLASAQEKHERYANQHRQPAPAYAPGDKVWLDFRNLSTGQPSKKLDTLHGKFSRRLAPRVPPGHPYTYRPS